MSNLDSDQKEKFWRDEEPPSDSTAYRKYLDRVFLASRDLSGVKATWIGLPSALGQGDEQYAWGPAVGPGYMRTLKAVLALKTTGANIEDAGDVVPPTTTLVARIRDKLASLFERSKAEVDGVHNLDKLIPYSKTVMEKVREVLSSGRKAIAVGGDHSIAMATIAGALEHFRGDLGVIWVDAHADINLPKRDDKGSPTANAQGMPVSHLMGLEGTNSELAGLISKSNRLKPGNIIYIGLKDLDREEIAYLDDMGITYFTVENSTPAQLETICRKIDELQNRVGQMWSSIDLDAIDQSVAPGTRMRNKGGLSYEMITALSQYIGVTTNLVGMDVAEFAPKFDDPDDKTAKLILELVARQLGGSKKRFDETAYLEKPVLAESPRKKVRRRNGFLGGGVAAATAAAALAIVSPNFSAPRQTDEAANTGGAVDDESLAKAGLRVAKESVSFLPILTPEWSADSGVDPVDLFSRSGFAEAAARYEEEADSERKNHALSEMMTYLHAALLKAADQTTKNGIWDVATSIVGQGGRAELMRQYRAFTSGVDDEKVLAWLKLTGNVPPG